MQITVVEDTSTAHNTSKDVYQKIALLPKENVVIDLK